MIDSDEFFKLILDTIADHIVVVDKEGNIQFVNHSWVSFAQNNSCLLDGSWAEMNYLDVCNRSAAMGDVQAQDAAEGISKVINSELDSFYFEYPCHSPESKRWFIMRVTPFQLRDTRYFVISHQNITQRKLAEEELLNQSRMDGLTDIPNRRYFDEFLNSEWKRCARLKMPISLVSIDVDYFKLFNDTYGHQAGDECLQSIGQVLKDFAKRPSDLCARIGGEEFSIVLGNTDAGESMDAAGKILNAIRGERIPHKSSPISPIVTASIGVATMYPDHDKSEKELIKSADSRLYSAKENGRNQVVSKNEG